MKTFRFILLALFALPVMAALWIGIDFQLFLNRPVAPEENRRLTVSRGSSLATVAAQLHRQGVIDDPRKFRWLARWRRVADKVQAGEYEFSAAATPDRVLRRLVDGDVRKHRLTVPEGLNLEEIAALAAGSGHFEAETFLALARAPRFIASLELEGAEETGSLEGYLFPETYTWSGRITEEELLQTMVAEFRRHYDPSLQERAAALGLSTHELVTLASIIQKEAGDEQEMPLIAAVFHNRLRRGIALQADPTVIYGLESFDGNLTRKHLMTPTPYNTYRMRGLPPGPIANPGEAALMAATAPADVDYLYFVARGDGTHAFSSTLREHNRAVRRYQLRR